MKIEALLFNYSSCEQAQKNIHTHIIVKSINSSILWNLKLYQNIIYLFNFVYNRNKDREIEDIEEKHQEEIKVYKQKLKLLMYEQHVHLSEVQVSCFCFVLFHVYIGTKKLQIIG